MLQIEAVHRVVSRRVLLRRQTPVADQRISSFARQTNADIVLVFVLDVLHDKYGSAEKALRASVLQRRRWPIERDKRLATHLLGHMLDILGGVNDSDASSEAILMEHSGETAWRLNLRLHDESRFVVRGPGNETRLVMSFFARVGDVTERDRHPIRLEQLKCLVLVEPQVSRLRSQLRNPG